MSRPYIEAAAPEHPALVDPGHKMDAMFGVLNVPNVVWIDECGVIVRPPEPGWPGPRPEGVMERLRAALPALGRAPNAPAPREGGPVDVLVQDPGNYTRVMWWHVQGEADHFDRC